MFKSNMYFMILFFNTYSFIYNTKLNSTMYIVIKILFKGVEVNA